MKRLGALVPAGECIGPDRLSARIRSAPAVGGEPSGFSERIHSVEKREILDALAGEGWNLARAARRLGDMPRSTLVSKMKRLGIARSSLAQGAGA
jgi:transcriptional regulator of acetoin/glycerol metabolism